MIDLYIPNNRVLGLLFKHEKTILFVIQIFYSLLSSPSDQHTTTLFEAQTLSLQIGTI